MPPQEILHFWFTELIPQQHFAKDAALDEAIRTRFGATREAAARCDLFVWRATPEGRLAEVLVLDQFSRNVYRHKTQRPRAFAQDALALALAQELAASGQDRSLPLAQRSFAYMPYMHSESALIHEQAVALFSQPGQEDNLRFEHAHKAITENKIGHDGPESSVTMPKSPVTLVRNTQPTAVVSHDTPAATQPAAVPRGHSGTENLLCQR